MKPPVLSSTYSVAQDTFLSIHCLQKEDAQRSETTIKGDSYGNMLHGMSCNHFCHKWVMLRQFYKLHATCVSYSKNGFCFYTMAFVAWHIGHAVFGYVQTI